MLYCLRKNNKKGNDMKITIKPKKKKDKKMEVKDIPPGYIYETGTGESCLRCSNGNAIISPSKNWQLYYNTSDSQR
jgi:hypothetical protein